jgi:hypothetical protein
MLRRTRFLMTCFVFTLFGALSVPRVSAQTGTVTCESRGNDREQCAIDRGARVELSRQVSDTPCRRNGNWGVGQEYIWVSGGCRAQFLVTAGSATGPTASAGATPMQLRACRSEADRRLPTYTYDQVSVEPVSRQGSVATVRWSAGSSAGLCTVATTGRIVRFTMNGAGGGYGDVETAGNTTQLTCESKGTDREECRIPEGARVRLVRQISQSPCLLNDTYGTGQGYLWVAKGCRAEFAVTEVASAPAVVPNAPAVVPAPGANARRSTRVVCESSGNARQQCPIREGANVQLVRRRSTAMCREGETWGTGPGYIWVSRGCGAEFEVRAADVGSGNAGGTGLPQQVTCESKGGERSECRIRTGAQVRLARQLSTTACVYNSTWGTRAGVIWVANGCRGEFEVR